MRYIKLYADDFDLDVWKQYCIACGVPTDTFTIKIAFEDKAVTAE